MKKITLFLIALVVLTTLLLVAGCGNNGQLQKQVNDLTAKSAAQGQKIDDLNAQIGNLNSENSKLESQNSAYLAKINILNASSGNVTSIAAERDAALKKVDALQQQVTGLEAQIKDLQSQSTANTSLDQFLPASLRNNAVVYKYSLNSVQLQLRGIVVDVNIPGLVLTLTHNGDNLDVPLYKDVLNGDTGGGFDLNTLEAGDKITVQAFFYSGPGSFQGVTIYTGNSIMNQW